MNQLSRRNFFKASGTALAGLFSAGIPGISDEEWSFIQPRPATQGLLARITVPTPVRATVGLNQPVVRWLHPETILSVFDVVEGDGANQRNRTWYRVDDGFVYSSNTQPMQPYRMPELVSDAGEWGFWAEVIVPYTLARTQPNGGLAAGEYRYHYATVYHVVDVDLDDAGNVWYKLYDQTPREIPETGWTPFPWVIGRHFRRIDESEFASFSMISDTAEKTIEVDLPNQEVFCYEDGQLVYSTMCSTGSEGFGTPWGEHNVVLKQPSRHMYGDGNLADPNFFDLPGVPWTTFFTTLGHAIHGTYWHSDYGRERSHGCVNVSPEASRWIYNWCTPAAPYESDFVPGDSATGTPVIVY